MKFVKVTAVRLQWRRSGGLQVWCSNKYLIIHCLIEFSAGGKSQTRLYDFVPELDKIIVSVHVVFNEVIPDLTADYFSELEKLKIEEAPDSQRLEDYDYVVGIHHIDDEDGLV
jgi:hypothetical protein